MSKAEIIMAIIGGITIVSAWLTYVIRSLYKRGMNDKRMTDVEVKVHGYDVRKIDCDTKFSEHGKLIAVSYERMAVTSEMINRIYDIYFKSFMG